MTTITVTRAVRNAVRQVLANSREYDADTMIIGRDGVTALKDADKTFAGNDPVRYFVGWAGEMVTADGAIRDGY